MRRDRLRLGDLAPVHDEIRDPQVRFGTDPPAIVSSLHERHPALPIVLLGYSLRGQLASLYAATHPRRIDGVVLVAAGTAHLDAWVGRERLIYRALVAAVRASRLGWPWYPGRLVGIGGDQPHVLMRDWLGVVDTGHYRLTGSAIDYEAACRGADLDVLEIGVDGDPRMPRLWRENAAMSQAPPVRFAGVWSCVS